MPPRRHGTTRSTRRRRCRTAHSTSPRRSPPPGRRHRRRSPNPSPNPKQPGKPPTRMPAWITAPVTTPRTRRRRRWPRGHGARHADGSPTRSGNGPRRDGPRHAAGSGPAGHTRQSTLASRPWRPSPGITPWIAVSDRFHPTLPPSSTQTLEQCGRHRRGEHRRRVALPVHHRRLPLIAVDGAITGSGRIVPAGRRRLQCAPPFHFHGSLAWRSSRCHRRQRRRPRGHAQAIPRRCRFAP